MSGDGGFESVWSDLQGMSFSQGYVEAAGINTRYLHSGSPDKPGLIFLHGTGGHAEAYTRNLGPHGEHFNTYFGLLEALQSLFGRPVDLVMTRAIKNPYFLKSVNQTRTVLYAA